METDRRSRSSSTRAVQTQADPGAFYSEPQAEKKRKKRKKRSEDSPAPPPANLEEDRRQRRTEYSTAPPPANLEEDRRKLVEERLKLETMKRDFLREKEEMEMEQPKKSHRKHRNPDKPPKSKFDEDFEKMWRHKFGESYNGR